MRDVAIVSFTQATCPRSDQEDSEMLVPVIADALASVGLTQRDIGFTVSGSCDFLGGRPFAFVMALDAVAAFPPIAESHVEMDGAWALYEAWVRLQHGDIDTALVYAFGRPSQGHLRDVLMLQLDPYYVAPLAPDAIALAALQARAMLDAGKCTERDLATLSAKRKRLSTAPDDLLRDPYRIAPLRDHAIPAVSDGVAAIVLAAGDRAKKLCSRPAYIRGIDHRIEPASLGARDLTRSVSTAIAGKHSGALDKKPDVAELHAPFAHQEILLREALGLDDSVDINPSGGALADNPMMVAGLIRMGEAATRVMEGKANRALAHATSGACLQQNLVCVLEAGR
jgi:acetyl-CoA acetyltransferase